MKLKIMLDKGAKMPTRAHPYDAGLDLYAPHDCVIPATMAKYGLTDEIEVSSLTIDTGVHVAIPEGCAGFIKSKSGLNKRYGLTTDGVVDAHYTGSIGVTLYNHSSDDFFVKKGQKIAQLVILPVALLEPKLVDHMEDTDRGTGGFGSTGEF